MQEHANHAQLDAHVLQPILVIHAEMLVNSETQLLMYANHALLPIVLFVLLLLINVIQMDAKPDTS